MTEKLLTGTLSLNTNKQTKMARQENGANVSKFLHNITSITSNVTLRFAPLATGPNFGTLKGQSEMTRNGMSSDLNKVVNSLDLILKRLNFC